jgi:hypothetical protein
MAARKRPSLRGQGADVFFTEREAEASQTAPQAADEKRVMATFYLPPTLVDRLDRAWLTRRMQDRKVQKSHLVAEALDAYLQA